MADAELSEWAPYGGFGVLPLDIWQHICELLSMNALRVLVLLNSSFTQLAEKEYSKRKFIVPNLLQLEAPQSGFTKHDDASTEWLDVGFLPSGKLTILSYCHDTQALSLQASASRWNLSRMCHYGTPRVSAGDSQCFSHFCISRNNGTIFLGWADQIYCFNSDLALLSTIELDDIGHIAHDEYENEIFITTPNQILVFADTGESNRAPRRSFSLSAISIAVGSSFLCCGILDDAGDKVQLVSKTTGAVLRTFTRLSEDVKWNIIDILVDRQDHIFVADLRDNGILVLDQNNGIVLHEFGDGALTGVSSVRLRDDGLLAVYEFPDSVSFFDSDTAANQVEQLKISS